MKSATAVAITRAAVTISAILVFAAFGSLEALAQGWQIMSADYGVVRQRVDVSGVVQRLAGSSFAVNSRTFGVADPAPGLVKTLRIMARDANGRSREFRYQEGQTVDGQMFSTGGRPYPGDGFGPLRIIQASYGTRGRYRDVTGLLQGMTSNGRLGVTVNNATMGGDPAPDRTKEVIVNYQYRGQNRTKRVREKRVLNLP